MHVSCACVYVEVLFELGIWEANTRESDRNDMTYKQGLGFSALDSHLENLKSGSGGGAWRGSLAGVNHGNIYVSFPFACPQLIFSPGSMACELYEYAREGFCPDLRITSVREKKWPNRKNKHWSGSAQWCLHKSRHAALSDPRASPLTSFNPGIEIGIGSKPAYATLHKNWGDIIAYRQRKQVAVCIWIIYCVTVSNYLQRITEPVLNLIRSARFDTS